MSVSSRPFREIRALYNDSFVRVYQAYSDEIADLAVKGNGFRAPMEAGCWCPTRMTWIKPSALWMAYRCGWTTMKDKRQARVLALDLDRSGFENLLSKAVLSHGSGSGKVNCRELPVVVQWDPERDFDLEAPKKQVFTHGVRAVRSIQIGLRKSSVEVLLDPAFVLQITDVTAQFRQAVQSLERGDLEAAREALFSAGEERPLEVSDELREILRMDVSPEDTEDDADEGEAGRTDTK
mmetsp:Transcript_56365/g.119951  ORF Transcript_56365/g.119951 Transcript_56365/m.119951 type:complete len:237 (-) Transcript_56365:308-1018(-)